jgi:hypothetical protein
MKRLLRIQNGKSERIDPRDWGIWEDSYSDFSLGIRRRVTSIRRRAGGGISTKRRDNRRLSGVNVGKKIQKFSNPFCGLVPIPFIGGSGGGKTAKIAGKNREKREAAIPENCSLTSCL